MNKDFINKIQDLLQIKKRNMEQEIERVVEDDPLLTDSLVESNEPGTDSWLTEAHTQLSAVKDNLQTGLNRVKKALENLSKGTYGKCERCGNPIEQQRLEAMPEASRCISCSKKK